MDPANLGYVRGSLCFDLSVTLREKVRQFQRLAILQLLRRDGIPHDYPSYRFPGATRSA